MTPRVTHTHTLSLSLDPPLSLSLARLSGRSLLLSGLFSPRHWEDCFESVRQRRRRSLNHYVRPNLLLQHGLVGQKGHDEPNEHLGMNSCPSTRMRF